MAKMLDAALDYARQDIPVFPCRTQDKRPITANGFKDATTDEGQIRLWWTQYPSAMIGMPTGKASGMWVLDVDVDPSKGIDGPKELEKLIAKNGPLPKTLTSATPRGGTHYFFVYDNIVIKNSTSKLAPGLDVRGEGGYVILPPSVCDSGTPYEWRINCPFNDPPAWALKALTSSPRDRAWAKKALETECAAVAASQPGERNDVLNKAAFNLGQLVGGGALDEDTVRDELYSAAVLCGLIDDDGEDATRKTIDSGTSAGRAQPRYRAGNGAQAALTLPPSPQPQPPPPPPPPGGTPGQSAASAPTPSPAPAPTRPVIRLIEDRLPQIVDEAEAALIAAKRHLYQRDELIVRPTKPKLPAANQRSTHAWRLHQVSEAEMVETFTSVARFEKMDHRVGDFVPKNCPRQIAETYLARCGRWKLPPLLGIVNTPFLRADGTVCERPGYDPNRALLFIPEGQSFPAVPQQPTLEDARDALQFVSDMLLSDFPFVADVDHSVMLSALLTAFDRRSIPTAPLHAFTSPVQGTGKSLLVDLIAILTSGQPAPVIAQGKSEEELEKRLASALLCGDQIISIDNCDYELSSNFLCQALTQQVLKIRLLGYSRHVNVSVASTFFATGNNLVIANDLIRRTLLCQMDAGVERPELRAFKSDVLEVAYQHRSKLVCAILTILRAWHVPGAAVEVAPTLGSFQDWSFRVRSPLVWLDQIDPVQSMENVRETDPARAELGAVLVQWERRLGTTKAFMIQEIINNAVTDADFFGALMAVAGSRHGVGISNERLGRYLMKNNGKIITRPVTIPRKPRLTLQRQSIAAGYPLWKLTEF
jgi:Bifunctional DNA primase/polymerase, N-terminal